MSTYKTEEKIIRKFSLITGNSSRTQWTLTKILPEMKLKDK